MDAEMDNAPQSLCLRRVVEKAGMFCPAGVRRVRDLPRAMRVELGKYEGHKLVADMWFGGELASHVFVVDKQEKTSRVAWKSEVEGESREVRLSTYKWLFDTPDAEDVVFAGYDSAVEMSEMEGEQAALDVLEMGIHEDTGAMIRATTRMRMQRSVSLFGVPSATSSSAASTETPVSGFCWTLLFLKEHENDLVVELGPFPSLAMLVQVDNAKRAPVHGHLIPGDERRVIAHVVQDTAGDALWNQIERAEKMDPLRAVGSWRSPPVVAGGPDREYESLKQRIGSTAPGFCYVNLFQESDQEEVAGALGRLPLAVDVLNYTGHPRAIVRGLIKEVQVANSYLHVYATSGTGDAWDELAQWAGEHPNMRIGLAAEADDDWARVASVAWRTWWFPAVLTVWVAAMCITSWTSRAFWIVLLVTPPLLAPFKRLVFRDNYSIVVTGVSGQLGSVLVETCRMMMMAMRGDFSLFCLYIWVTIPSWISSLIGLWQCADLVRQNTQQVGQVMYGMLVAVSEWSLTVAREREEQAKPRPEETWVKSVLMAVASVLRAVALAFSNSKTGRDLNSLATAMTTCAHASNLRHAVEQISEVIVGQSGMRESPSHDGGVDAYDLPDSEVPSECIHPDDSDMKADGERVAQSGETFPDNCCRHLVTKNNIMSVADKFAQCEWGSVHIITAATGTGKSTVIPYMLSQSTDKEIAVSIPLISAVRSSASVIQQRFGVTPHTHSEGEHIRGNCNVHLYTSASLATKLKYQPLWATGLGALVCDEMHVPSDHNDLLRRLSPRLASKITVLWCSATFAQSFTLPGDLSHPVHEVLDKTVTRENIFTSKCNVKQVSSKGIRGRYLVFCASVRDTQTVARRFSKSKIPVFAISSKNFETEFPKAKAALEDLSLTTVVVASTPCLETGVTVPLNYVVDLREQIIPKMSYDPPELTTKRVRVTKGMAIQRKGRVGRLFRGWYIAPPVTFHPTSLVDEGSLSSAVLYGRLFGYRVTQARPMPTLENKVLTDSFLKNCEATRMDPLAVAGMTTPEGRIFKSFETFEFPKGARKQDMVFSPHMFPESLWQTWPKYETSEWTQWLEREQRYQIGKTVRAPFWDHTTDDKVQIDNWQLKVFCYRGANVTDAAYNDPAFMTTSCLDKLKSSWLNLRGREMQSPARLEYESGEWHDGQDGAETTDDKPRRKIKTSEAMAMVPLWVALEGMQTLAPVIVFGWIVLLMVLAAVLIWRRWPRRTEGTDSERSCAEPTGARSAARRGVGKRTPERQRIRHVSGRELDPDGYVTVHSYWDDQDRRIPVDELERELDVMFGIDGHPTTDWANDYVTVTGVDADGNSFQHDYYESARNTVRTAEVKLNVKTPEYSTRQVRDSTVALMAPGATSPHGYGVIVRKMIFANKHVLQECGRRVRIVSSRGTFEVEPNVVIEEKDLAVFLLPSGIPGTANNLTLRVPVEGEDVALVRCDPTSARGSLAVPSEVSPIAPGVEGFFGYQINTEAGDCGTAVIATRDGAFLGVHGLGGNRLDQANFFWPLTQRIVSEVHRRQPQNAPSNVIVMPPLPDAFDLGGTSRVAPEEQRKHPVEELGMERQARWTPVNAGSFVEVATLKKHVSEASKITIDPYACAVLRDPSKPVFEQFQSYLPSAMVDGAFWKDVGKYDRCPTLVPQDFDEEALACWRAIAPWVFEPVRVLEPDEVYFRVDKTKSSGPRLSGKKGDYMSGLNPHEFRQLIAACESVYEVPSAEFVAPVWQVALKDELRDKDRVAAIKTRTFMSGPIESVLGNVRITGDFNDRFVDKHLEFPSTIGLDKFNGGWQRVAEFLGETGMVYSGGDGSRFDSSVGASLLGMSCYMRMAGLPKKYHRHLVNWYGEVLFTPLVMKDQVVRRKCTGNPSGQVNTSEDNTVALISVAFYAFTKILGRDVFLALYKEGKLRFLANGDDFIFAVHENYEDKVDRKRLQDLFAECGLTYEFSAYTSQLSEMVYLGHKFTQRLVSGKMVWVPQLESDRVVASCVYRRSTNAVDTHARYLGAYIHSTFDRDLHAKIGRLLLGNVRRAMAHSNFSTDAYDSRFPLFSRAGVIGLYTGMKVGLASKTYSNKNIGSLQRIRQSSAMSGALETEHGVGGAEAFDDNVSVIDEAEADHDVRLEKKMGKNQVGHVMTSMKGFEPSISSLFQSTQSVSVRERLIVSRASKRQVAETVTALRDLMSIDSESTMSRVIVDLMIYYVDNSTSSQTPHVFPYELHDRKIDFNEVDACFIPTVRKFWRTMANFVHEWLEHNPSVWPHWGNVHGLPKKYRSYWFDFADACDNIPDEARQAILAAKDVALTRSKYNLMRADLKAAGSGGGTVVKQIAGDQFARRSFASE